MGIHKPNKRILILCEGETEYYYAKALQQNMPRLFQRSLSIEIDHNCKNDPGNLAKEARRRKVTARRERNPYDSIWLFFDNDNWPQLREAVVIIDQEGVKFAYSSICIEHWFILHFENCQRAFTNGSEALKYLRLLWPQYHKTTMPHFKFLETRLCDALNHVLSIKKNADKDTPIHRRNPFFTIDELIDFFKDLESGKIL